MKRNEDLLEPLTGLTKGMPSAKTKVSIGEVAAQGWNVLREDLALPLAILRKSALDRNERWMRNFCEAADVTIAPHGRTTMSPQLFQHQMDAGAWAMTVATLQQLRVCREFGHRRVIFANQLIGRQAINYVTSELRNDPSFEFYCLVDSVRGVEILIDALTHNPAGRPLNVLLEGGSVGGRTGCRTVEEALAVARAVKGASPHLALRGVEGFEGLNTESSDESVQAFLKALVTIAEACARENLFADGPVLLSAGGSAFFDLVADAFHAADLERPVQVLTRSGCYISLDAAMYTRSIERLLHRKPALADLGPAPRNAREIWAYVQSRPEPTKVILTAGKRDLSYDVHLPIALHWHRPGEDVVHQVPAQHTIIGLNDQHAHMTVPADSPLQVGDMVGLGVSHPCTTFDKWQVMFIVDDSYNVVDAIRTFF
ncbi:amino acid deaminase [Microvirga sp. KLBC 81]|uniref:amino acid deaminase n=1 Tax=Microvirga sp. KLBC 81 TaxID=1862707 RepID=UPI000D511457|nr:amino acid deaminase [Microvirga sp. KLBC 81]PVE23626.1 amino acid deaminase [Microvirga sp. KLBC 81]